MRWGTHHDAGELMIDVDEPERSRGPLASLGRWLSLGAVGLAALAVPVASAFVMPGNALVAGELTATPAASTSSGIVDLTTWAPLSGFGPSPALSTADIVSQLLAQSAVPVAAEGDEPSVLITPRAKTSTEPSRAIGWPVAMHMISSPFGLRTDPLTRTTRFHTGTDFPAGCGTPIQASLDGTVSGAGQAGAYGNRIVLEHGQRYGGNFTTTYSHLSQISVSEGQSVTRGQLIGYVGTTGRSTGCHLHFEAIIDHTLFDPIPLLLGEQPSGVKWPVGLFMPYGTSVSLDASPTPDLSGSPTPGLSVSGSPSASASSPGASASSTPPKPSGASSTPAHSSTPSGSVTSSAPPSTTTPPASETTTPKETTPPPSETTPPPAETTSPPSETTPPPAETTAPAETSPPPADPTGSATP